MFFSAKLCHLKQQSGVRHSILGQTFQFNDLNSKFFYGHLFLLRLNFATFTVIFPLGKIFRPMNKLNHFHEESNWCLTQFIIIRIKDANILTWKIALHISIDKLLIFDELPVESMKSLRFRYIIAVCCTIANANCLHKRCHYFNWLC